MNAVTVATVAVVVAVTTTITVVVATTGTTKTRTRTVTVIETVRRVGRWRIPYVLVRVFVRERGWSVARVVVSKMKSDSKPLLTAQAEKANHYT